MKTIITRTFQEKRITIDTGKGSFSWLEIKEGRKKIGTISEQKDGLFLVSTKEGTATYRQTKEACQAWLQIVHQNPFCETIFNWK